MTDVTAGLSKLIQLPCGLGPDDQGRIHREAEILPMTGAVRKNIARPDVRQSPSKVIDVVLLAGVKRIGSLPRIDRNVLNDLLAGDRDFLMLEIRKLSLGAEVTSTITCGECDQKVDIRFDLNKIPSASIPEKCEVVNGKRVFTIEIPYQGKTIKAVFRYPNGSDQAAVSTSKNPIESNYTLYYRCLLEWNGVSVEQCSPVLFDDMPLTALDVVEDEFRNKMPGPVLSQAMICPLCGAETPLNLGASDFLFRSAKARMSTG